ncbi:hypothetical protein AVEN_51354-1 [Araneus ventricosus]|uniref:HAUS augmin-like complex subunit 1 n=1 Tax=Araneus ventricosus TaxID=182803 RepID=A0A4Y2IAA6_ARAVE|nr:hypothetical protein AVEN_51354-1 [Araneus ventricosus]
MEESKEFSHFCSNQNIQQWLKDVFQEEDIPSFDETPEFIEALKKIINENEAAEKDAKVIMKAEKNMKDFYNEKTEELQLVTDFIQLNSETCRRVQSLASLGENMKLKEPSLTNFLLAMTEIEDKELMQAEKKLVTSHHMSVFSKKIMHTMKMNEKLRRYLKSVTKVVDTQKTHYTEIMNGIRYFGKKKREIEDQIKGSKNSLDVAGYSEDTGVRHSVLVEKAQKLKDLEEHRKTLENKLQAYHSLKPNMEETVDAVKTKEKELIKLEKELQILLQAFETS